jgi:hypothetical protein
LGAKASRVARQRNSEDQQRFSSQRIREKGVEEIKEQKNGGKGALPK